MNLQQQYEQLQSGCDQLLGLLSAQEQQVQSLEQEVARLEQEVKILTLTSAVLSQLVQSVSIESVASTERLVSAGLRTVFPDQSLRFGLDVSSKRGATYCDPYLVEGNVKAPILEAFGGGPAAIVAFLLRLIVCQRLKLAPLMLLDESFSFVSSGYVDLCSKLLRELSEKLGLTILLVSHQPGFLEFANRAYEAKESSSGTVFKPVKVT